MDGSKVPHSKREAHSISYPTISFASFDACNSRSLEPPVHQVRTFGKSQAMVQTVWFDLLKRRP